MDEINISTDIITNQYKSKVSQCKSVQSLMQIMSQSKREFDSKVAAISKADAEINDEYKTAVSTLDQDIVLKQSNIGQMDKEIQELQR